MKKTVTLLLAAAILVSCFAVGASAGTATEKVGNFRYSSISDSTADGIYYYRDDYFAADASLYQPSLASMSFCLAASTSAVDLTFAHKADYTIAILNDTGFSDIYVNPAYTVRPTEDSIGMVMGRKTITANGTPYTLLAVAVRGGAYESEWASNFTLGKSGEHAGFADAASLVEAELAAYAADHPAIFEHPVKLWVTGYSRGAAVANLVAAHLTKAAAFGGKPIAKENIYGYTFETPRCTSTDVVTKEEAAGYTNIHNICNPNDAVATLPPTAYGFLRYGTDEAVIPTAQNDENAALYAEMLARYIAIDSPGVQMSLTTDESGAVLNAVDHFTMKELNLTPTALAKIGSLKKVNGKYRYQFADYATVRAALVKETPCTVGECIAKLEESLCRGIGSRENYVETLQSPLRILLSEWLGTRLQRDKLILFCNAWQKQAHDHAAEWISLFASKDKAALTAAVNEAIQICGEQSGLLTEDYRDTFQNLSKTVLALADVVTAEWDLNLASAMISILEDTDAVACGHLPELCFSWLQVADTNYFSDAPTHAEMVALCSSKPDGCRYERLSVAKTGCFRTVIGGKQATLSLRRSGTGFTLFDETAKRYIGENGALSATPTVWEYNGGFYRVATPKVKFALLARLLGKGDTIQYLTLTDSGAAVTSKVTMAKLYETVEKPTHTVYGDKCIYCRKAA